MASALSFAVYYRAPLQQMTALQILLLALLYSVLCCSEDPTREACLLDYYCRIQTAIKASGLSSWFGAAGQL
eukprot:scaffold153947_cov39-Prasinocladus_malaysianus.AAC.1